MQAAVKTGIVMITSIHPLKFCKISTVAVLFVLTSASCKPAAVTPTSTPVIRTVEVTRDVTQEVTREVTRIVEVPIPVTVTPTLTPAITLTPSLTGTSTHAPTITPTPDPPVITILVHSACNFGPGGAYLSGSSWLEPLLGEDRPRTVQCWWRGKEL
jgi:hypothetical protein